MTSNMTLIDTNDRWLLKLPSALPIVSFIPFARALRIAFLDAPPFYPLIGRYCVGKLNSKQASKHRLSPSGLFEVGPGLPGS
jgi:hypothetical protein